MPTTQTMQTMQTTNVGVCWRRIFNHQQTLNPESLVPQGIQDICWFVGVVGGRVIMSIFTNILGVNVGEKMLAQTLAGK